MNSKNSIGKVGNRMWLYLNHLGQMISTSSMVGDAVFSTLIKFIRLDTHNVQSYHEVVAWIKAKSGGNPDVLEKFTSKIWLDEDTQKITELGLEPLHRYYYVLYVSKTIDVIPTQQFNKQFKIVH